MDGVAASCIFLLTFLNSSAFPFDHMIELVKGLCRSGAMLLQRVVPCLTFLTAKPHKRDNSSKSWPNLLDAPTVSGLHHPFRAHISWEPISHLRLAWASNGHLLSLLHSLPFLAVPDGLLRNKGGATAGGGPSDPPSLLLWGERPHFKMLHSTTPQLGYIHASVEMDLVLYLPFTVEQGHIPNDY